MSVQSVVDTSFAIEAIFLAAQVFILSFYLTKWEEGSEEKKMKPLLYLTISLVIPGFLLLAVNLILLLHLETNYLVKVIYTFFSVLLAIPNITTILLIIKKKP